jgi:hypothetical protein
MEDDGNKSQDSPKKSSSQSMRMSVGAGTKRLSEIVNENLIVARYATFASIALLTAYGIAHTPLFFRYQSVAEIPTLYFHRRRKIPCRLMKMMPVGPEQPVLCQIRHLSLFERVLSKSLFERFIKFHPSSLISNDRDYLTIEIAGVRSPPDYHGADLDAQWLENMALQRQRFSCQLLARRKIKKNKTKKLPSKRPLSEFSESDSSRQGSIAVARLSYRPGFVISDDLAESMVRQGRALPNDSFFGESQFKLLDASESVEDSQRDIKYMSRLASAEYEAAKVSS